MRLLLIALAIILVALHYRLWFADDGIIHAVLLKKAISEQQEKIDSIVAENGVLADEIGRLKKGGVAIESRARNDLGMVKKGEVFYQVVK